MLSRDRAVMTSAWSPLRQPLFRALRLATVTSSIGTWMQSTGAVWLMTSLTPSPLMVALVQTATSLPFFLLALPAGAPADMVDRRRLLLGTQGWMLTAAVVLGLLMLVGATTPWTLRRCMSLGTSGLAGCHGYVTNVAPRVRFRWWDSRWGTHVKDYPP